MILRGREFAWEQILVQLISPRIDEFVGGFRLRSVAGSFFYAFEVKSVVRIGSIFIRWGSCPEAACTGFEVPIIFIFESMHFFMNPIAVIESDLLESAWSNRGEQDPDPGLGKYPGQIECWPRSLF